MHDSGVAVSVGGEVVEVGFDGVVVDKGIVENGEVEPTVTEDAGLIKSQQ
jgi:hypothetical protein